MLFLHVSRIYLLYLPKIGIFYIFNRVVTNNLKKNMKNKGVKEIRKKPQTDKVKVKSDYQMEKNRSGDSLTKSIIKGT